MRTLSFVSTAALALAAAAVFTAASPDAQATHAWALAAALPNTGDARHQLDARRAGLSFKDANGLSAAVQDADVDASHGDASALDFLVLVADTQCNNPVLADHWLCEAGK